MHFELSSACEKVCYLRAPQADRFIRYKLDVEPRSLGGCLLIRFVLDYVREVDYPEATAVLRDPDELRLCVGHSELAYSQPFSPPTPQGQNTRMPLKSQELLSWTGRMQDNKWARLLAYVTGLVNQDLLLQNEYLIAEDRILRAQLPKRVRLLDAQRSTLAEIGKRLRRKALRQIACVSKPDTILAWYRRLVAHKFDGSNSAERREDLQSNLRSNSWWCTWHVRTPAGLRSHPRSAGQPRTRNLGPDRREHPPAPRHRAGTETQPDHHIEGFHPGTQGCARRSRLFHRRSADLARVGDLLRRVLYSS
jgi:hypothetical protein